MQRNKFNWTLWLSAAAAVIGVVTLIIIGSSPNAYIKIPNQIEATDWTKGNKEAKVTLIEYSDLQCPACKAFQPILTSLMAEFDDHILFAYRHYPLKTIHQNAVIAAQAAEAAGLQGKFWEMHDKLFETQTLWGTQSRSGAIEDFTEYAVELGLDAEKFKTDIESAEVEDKVEGSFRTATDAGLNSTPTFFLNGEQIRNPKNLEEFRNVIRNALEQTN